jgi:hypothetical protein
MRNVLLAIVLAVLSASHAAAGEPGRLKLDMSADPAKPLAVTKSSGSGNSCAAYGAGFIKVEGTNTCIKAGGSVIVETGSGGSFSRR